MSYAISASVSNEDVESGNSDGIIREFIKACRETRKNDEAQTQNEPDENYPSLDDVSAATSVPRLRGAIFSRKFSPSLKNPKPQLGFNVEASEELFRLMGGESLQENRKIQSYHDTGGPRFFLFITLHYITLYNNTCSFCIFIGRELCFITVHTHG